MPPLLMKNARETYRKQDILTASPLELILMLYDGIRKNVTFARKAMERNDMPSAHSRLIKAQDIITELVNSLDLTIPLSEELLKLYEFMIFALKEANIKKDPAMLGEVLEISENLRSAWQEVNQSVRDGALTEPEPEVGL